MEGWVEGWTASFGLLTLPCFPVSTPRAGRGRQGAHEVGDSGAAEAPSEHRCEPGHPTGDVGRRPPGVGLERALAGAPTRGLVREIPSITRTSGEMEDAYLIMFMCRFVGRIAMIPCAAGSRRGVGRAAEGCGRSGP